MPGPGDRIINDANLNAFIDSLKKGKNAGQVIWNDLGLNQFIKNLDELSHLLLYVGVVGPAALETSSSGKITVGEAAFINEYGSRAANIPARHFVSGSITPYRAQLEADRMVKGVLEFREPKALMDESGERLAERIRERIYQGKFVANAPSTVKKKGFNQPLIESSQLADSITHQVVKDNEAVQDGMEVFQVVDGSAGEV